MVWRKDAVRKMSGDFLRSMSKRERWVNKLFFFPRRWEGSGEYLGGFERVERWEGGKSMGAAGVW